MYIYKR